MARIIFNNNNGTTEADSANLSNDFDGEAGARMKKGPWTPQEDVILVKYVRQYGEGNWNSVQKNSGLLRCGKSCRLRWANHLRPNLKKGGFSQEEEQIIIDLHAKLGNKWARMAAQLPGRTDNEIKNFWNTRMKRRQRAGLPIYPPGVQAEANAYHHHLQQQQHLEQPFSSSSSLSFSLLLSSCYPKKLDEPTNYSAANANPLQNNHPAESVNHYTNPCPQFNFSNENNSGINGTALPMSPLSPYASSISSTLFNQGFAAPTTAPTDSHDYQYSGCSSYDHGFIGGFQYEPFPLVPGLTATEISSSQTTIDSVSVTPASSHASGIDGFNMGASSAMVNDYCEVAPLSPQRNYSGLLGDVVMHAQTLCRSDKSKSEDSTLAEKVSHKRKSMVADQEYDAQEGDTDPVESSLMKKNSGDTTNETQKEDISSSQLSTGKKLVAEEPLEEMNPMDDDLFSLINNFPSEVPTMPEWYRGGKSESLGLETQPDVASHGPTDQEFDWTLGTSWNNLPGIC